MSELRTWATNLSLILIVTGIFMKTVSSKNEKMILRFVVTMILIVSVFQLNVSQVAENFSFDINGEISGDTEILNNNLMNSLSAFGKEQIDETVRKTVQNYDGKASVVTELSENAVHVIIKSDIITSNDIGSIKGELQNEFDCEIIIERGERG
ncbi:MAG: hypothetical protein ACI4F5_05670 [Acutalibacteraceae bacterium]